jgi:hypothetical protein
LPRISAIIPSRPRNWRAPWPEPDLGVTARGHMRFMVIEKGRINADAFIELQKRLIKEAERESFLSVDNGSAHRARKTTAFVGSQVGKQRLSYLPPYSPDRSAHHSTEFRSAEPLDRFAGRIGVEASEGGYGRPHGCDQQGRFRREGSPIDAALATQYQKNHLLLPNPIT